MDYCARSLRLSSGLARGIHKKQSLMIWFVWNKRIGICNAVCLGGSLLYVCSMIFPSFHYFPICLFAYLCSPHFSTSLRPYFLDNPKIGHSSARLNSWCRSAASTKTTRMGEVHKNRGRILKCNRSTDTINGKNLLHYFIVRRCPGFLSIKI